MNFINVLIANSGPQLVKGLTIFWPPIPYICCMLLINFLHQFRRLRGCGWLCRTWSFIGHDCFNSCTTCTTCPLHFVVSHTMRHQCANKFAITQYNCLVHHYLNIVFFAERFGYDLQKEIVKELWLFDFRQELWIDRYVAHFHSIIRTIFGITHLRNAHRHSKRSWRGWFQYAY